MYKTITGKQALIILGNGENDNAVEFYEDGRWFKLIGYIENFSVLDLLSDDFEFRITTEVYNKLFDDDWISVDEALPNEDDQVLGYSVNGLVDTYETLWLEDFGIWYVRHWKPLPKPPKENK